jgi:hypothetical protein
MAFQALMVTMRLTSGQAGLVIGYGRPPEHAYTTALARLCAVLPGFR